MGSGYPNHVMEQNLYPLSHLTHLPKYTLSVSFTSQNLLCDLPIIKVLFVFLFGLIVLFIPEFYFLELYIQYTFFLLKMMSRILLASLPR